MSKWVVDIHGDIEGDYEIIKKYEEPKADVLDKIEAEIDQKQYDFMDDKDYDEGIRFGLMLAYQIINKYKAGSEDKK